MNEPLTIRECGEAVAVWLENATALELARLLTALLQSYPTSHEQYVSWAALRGHLIALLARKEKES